MSKSAELMRLIGIILLSLLLVGTVTFAAARFEKSFISSHPTPHTPKIAQTAPFSEYASLRTAYERELEKSIEKTLSKITGNHTVKSKVTADIDLQQETNDKRFYEQKTDTDFTTQKVSTHKTFENIQKLSVTVLVDGYMQNDIYQPRSSRDMLIYADIVKSLIGFTPTRGDRLEVLNMPFTDTLPETLFGLPRYHALSLIVTATIGGLMLLLLAFFILPMMKQLMTPCGAGAQITPPLPIKSLEKSPISKATALFHSHPTLALKTLRNWLYGKPENASRTAVLLLSLGETNIKHVFMHLTDTEITTISRAMGELGRIPTETVNTIVEQFLQDAQSPLSVIGTPDQTEHLLATALPREKATEIIDTLSTPTPGKTVWDKLTHIDTDQLVPYLEKESPQMIAIILYHLPNEKAGKILARMDKNIRENVITRIADMAPIDADTLAAIEQGLETQIKTFFARPNTPTGRAKLADILSLLDKTQEESILRPLYTSAPETAKHISDHILSFDRLSKWDDDSLQLLLKHADRETVALALKGASDNIKDAFSRNMSPRIWASLMKDVAALGAVRIGQIDSAQIALLKLAQQLIATRKINIKDFA